jgi:putative transposase
MSGTHLSLHYHLVFSTKNRHPLIKESWEPRLHAYLGGIISKMGAISDHIHIAVGLKAAHCISEVLREIKAGSSAWMHRELGYRFFNWQNGYGAFTVSSFNLHDLKHYIDNQKEHHKKKSFQEEYRELLLQSGIEFDERYLW